MIRVYSLKSFPKLSVNIKSTDNLFHVILNFPVNTCFAVKKMENFPVNTHQNDGISLRGKDMSEQKNSGCSLVEFHVALEVLKSPWKTFHAQILCYMPE